MPLRTIPSILNNGHIDVRARQTTRNHLAQCAPRHRDAPRPSSIACPHRKTAMAIARSQRRLAPSGARARRALARGNANATFGAELERPAISTRNRTFVDRSYGFTALRTQGSSRSIRISTRTGKRSAGRFRTRRCDRPSRRMPSRRRVTSAKERCLINAKRRYVAPPARATSSEIRAPSFSLRTPALVAF